MENRWILFGAILAGLAVVTGAFGAHGLEGFLGERHSEAPKLFERRMGNWNTAALYQMHHALGLIAVGIIALFRRNKSLNIAGWCFLIGIIFFSGSLYSLVILEIPVLGAITPIGGVSFIVGWLALVFGAQSLSNNRTEPVS